MVANRVDLGGSDNALTHLVPGLVVTLPLSDIEDGLGLVRGILGKVLGKVIGFTACREAALSSGLQVGDKGPGLGLDEEVLAGGSWGYIIILGHLRLLQHLGSGADL